MPVLIDFLTGMFFDSKSTYSSIGFISMVLLQNERMQNLNLKGKARLRRHSQVRSL